MGLPEDVTSKQGLGQEQTTGLFQPPTRGVSDPGLGTPLCRIRPVYAFGMSLGSPTIASRNARLTAGEAGNELVVTYEPDSPDGFYLVYRDDDEDIIRRPDPHGV